MNHRLKTKPSAEPLNNAQWKTRWNNRAAKMPNMTNMYGFSVCIILIVVLLFPELVTAKTTRPPEIGINRTNLNYGATKNGMTTSTLTNNQQFTITNSGPGTLNWGLNDDQYWLICTPTQGTLSTNQSSTITVGVEPCGLPAGQYSGTITVTDQDTPSNSKQIPVNLNYIAPGDDLPPFGTFDTPQGNSTVQSSIPVTGWVLDDVQTENVKIYNGSNYVGDAVFVDGARPDVEQSYSTYPLNYQAGWGYMMLTNFLPNGGNGTYEITAIATDSGGNQTNLGSKTIYGDNAHAVKPFGAIDTPSQGGSASGSNYVNWGWALTPLPNYLHTSGSTINVYVDGVNRGHPKYSIYREDISKFFPDYANSSGAAGYYKVDTTNYKKGVHTIQWTATDNAGNSDGIGSRYFSINNADGDRPYTAATAIDPGLLPPEFDTLIDIPRQDRSPVTLKKGFSENLPPMEKYPDNDGFINIQMKELDRIELGLFNTPGQTGDIFGFLLVNGKRYPLPIGSTLDSKNNTFYWMPGLAYLGKYHLVFIKIEPNAEMSRQDIIVTIVPRFQ